MVKIISLLLYYFSIVANAQPGTREELEKQPTIEKELNKPKGCLTTIAKSKENYVQDLMASKHTGQDY
jgi:hypothetical protein